MSAHDAGEVAGFLMADPTAALDLATARYASPSERRAFALAYLEGAVKALWCARRAGDVATR